MYMNTTTINIKADPKVKLQAQKIAAELGLTLSGVLNGFLKQFVRTKKVQFSLEENETPSPYLIQALKEAEEDRKNGWVSPGFDKAEDAIAWLHDPERKYANQIK